MGLEIPLEAAMTSRPRWYAGTLVLASLLALPATPVAAQLIQIKTLPIADGDQWQLFPLANQGLGGVSIALRDSLLDPFDNPAKGARTERPNERHLLRVAHGRTPVSQNAGGGMTLPIGGIWSAPVRRSADFAVAIQEIDAAQTQQGFLPPTVDIVRQDGTPGARADQPVAPESVRVRHARPNV